MVTRGILCIVVINTFSYASSAYAADTIKIQEKFAPTLHLVDKTVHASFFNSIISGANRPSHLVDKTIDVKGFSQGLSLHYYSPINGLFASAQYNTLDSEHGIVAKNGTKNLQLAFAKNTSFGILLGIGIESFESKVESQRTVTDLDYVQLSLLAAKIYSHSSILLQYSPITDASLEIRDKATKSRDSLQGQVSSFLNLQYAFQDNENRFDYFVSTTYDFADAFSNGEDKPNAPLRHKWLLTASQELSDGFFLEYSFLRNRGFFSNLVQNFSRPFHMLSLLVKVSVSPNATAFTGFASDFGGVLNNSAKKERWQTFLFGFNYQN